MLCFVSYLYTFAKFDHYKKQTRWCIGSLVNKSTSWIVFWQIYEEKNLVMFGGKYWIVGKPAMAASLQISWEQEIIPRDFYRTLFFCAISAEQILTLWQSWETVRNFMFLFVSKPGCFSLPHSRLQLPENIILKDGF